MDWSGVLVGVFAGLIWAIFFKKPKKPSQRPADANNEMFHPSVRVESLRQQVVLEDSRRLIAEGADSELILLLLRDGGFDQVHSIEAIQDLMGKSGPEAKELVCSSKAWSDRFYSVQDLREKAREALLDFYSVQDLREDLHQREREALRKLAASSYKELPEIELVGFDDTEWTPVLRRLNGLVLRSFRLPRLERPIQLEQFRREIAKKAVSSGWCGQPPATESEIREAEVRLGVTLPPSYRSFLLISNGWRPLNRDGECLFPVQQIDRFCICDPESLASFESAHERIFRIFGDELFSVSDEVYLNYPKRHGGIRRYYGDSLLIGAPWEGCGTKLRREGRAFLLNPHIVFPNGEWQTICAARPASCGRFRSFREFVEDSVLRGEIGDLRFHSGAEFGGRLPKNKS